MIIDTDRFKEQFDEDGYVIVRNLMPLEIMNNAQTAIERLVAELAEERVATGRIPHSFKEEPFARRFKKIYENEPEAGPIQFTNQLHQSELYDLYSYPPILDLVQSYLGDEIRLLVYVVRMRAFRHQKCQSLWHQDAGYLGQDVVNPNTPMKHMPSYAMSIVGHLSSRSTPITDVWSLFQAHTNSAWSNMLRFLPTIISILILS